MKPYENYKNTDIAWLGEVPSHWEVSKLGRILKPFSQKNHAHLPLLSITRELGVIERDVENQDENHNFIPDDLSGYKLLKKGQFGMNKMKAWQGSYGVSPYTGIVSPAYFIFDFMKEVNPDFFHWAIRCKLYISFFGSASDGVRIGQWDLSKSRMKEIPFVIPPLPEQIAIANFLDCKTTQIQKAIALKSEQIAKLKEYRQTLINQTVTQGLNPNVAMKNSGVEWLGKVPSHWEVKRLKFISSIEKGKLPKSIVQENSGSLPVYMSMEYLRGGEANQWVADKKVKIAQLGDILLLWDGSNAGEFLKAREGVISSTIASIFVYDIKKEYAWYALKSFEKELKRVTIGMGIPHVNGVFLKNAYIPIPPLSEQLAIAEFLDNKTAQIDTAIRHYQAQIDKLKEYQQSLVNDVVTGKVQVERFFL